MKEKANIRRVLSVVVHLKSAFLLCLMSVFLFLPSCTLQTNIQSNRNLNHPLPLDEKAFSYFGFEVETDKILWDQIDFAFGIGTYYGESEGELTTTRGTIPEVSTGMTAYRLSSRWFPFEKKIDKIKPYAGFGIGYFDFYLDINSRGDYLYSDYLYSGGIREIRYYELDKDVKTLASGFFPFFSLGFYLPIAEHKDKMEWALQFEYQHDFNQEDNGFDLSGSQFIIGLGLTWK